MNEEHYLKKSLRAKSWTGLVQIVLSGRETMRCRMDAMAWRVGWTPSIIDTQLFCLVGARCVTINLISGKSTISIMNGPVLFEGSLLH